MLALRRSWPFFLLLAGLAIFLVFSNEFDWDHFYSTSEVDLRSWLVDHEAPLWSYQFCAGVTRIGDPQAFGLSPLFLPVILFGAVWGLKAIILLSAIIGWFFLRKSGLLLISKLGVVTTQENSSAVDFLATCVIFSNYFLWHFHQGHITFALTYFVFAFLYFFLTSIWDSLHLRDAVVLVALTFSYLTAGFYHSAVFSALPIALSLIVLLFATILSGQMVGKWRSFSLFLISLGLGAGLGAYKTLAVIRYQHDFPRTLSGPSEPMSLLQSAILQFVPTYHYRFIGMSYLPSPWAIWEYGAFNLAAWFFAISLLVIGYKKCRESIHRLVAPGISRMILIWLSVLGCIGISLSCSSDSPLSLHYWLNIPLQNSVRVIGRYQIVWIVWFFFGSVTLIALQPKLISLFSSKIKITASIFLLFNFLSFTTLNTRQANVLFHMPSIVPEKINSLATAPVRDDFNSHMYGLIANGAIVPNCYNPLTRGKALMSETRGLAEFTGERGEIRPKAMYPLVVGTNLPVSCMENTYVTQNDIHLDPSCPVGACINLNGLNIYRPQPGNLRWVKERHRICVENAH